MQSWVPDECSSTHGPANTQCSAWTVRSRLTFMKSSPAHEQGRAQCQMKKRDELKQAMGQFCYLPSFLPSFQPGTAFGWGALLLLSHVQWTTLTVKDVKEREESIPRTIVNSWTVKKRFLLNRCNRRPLCAWLFLGSLPRVGEEGSSQHQPCSQRQEMEEKKTRLLHKVSPWKKGRKNTARERKMNGINGWWKK